MTIEMEKYIKSQLKTDLPDLRPGDTVRVYQKFSSRSDEEKTTEKKEERGGKIQTFEGLILTRKHGKEVGATIAVRKEISGIGVEKTFPLHSPTIEKIEILKRGKVRRAKLYYLRKAGGKRARLKEK